LRGQPFRAASVVAGLIRMIMYLAIDLDRQPGALAPEVEDERAYGVLASKSRALLFARAGPATV